MNAGWRLWPRISWNPPNFTLKSGRFHSDFTCEIHPNYKVSVLAKTLQFDECKVRDFTLKSGGFHLWNLVDFTGQIWVGILPWKSSDFTLKSGGFHPWNLADFTQISPVKSTQNYKSKCFSKNSSVWWMQGGGFHPWNRPDFTLKSGGFDLWNLVDFTQISPVKSTQNYKSKCFSKNSSVWWMQGGGFHPRNPMDFTMKSGRFHPDFTCEIHPKL